MPHRNDPSNVVTRSALVTVAVVVAVAVSATVGATAATSPAVQESDSHEFSVIQGDECITVEPLGHGHQEIEEFYDYRTPESEPPAPTYSSHGTSHLQEPNTSILFFHESNDGLSLVMVHDAVNSESDGGSATFQLEDVPEDGEWVIQDDDYNGSEDVFDHRESTSRMSWTWDDNRSDGAAFQGGLEDDFEMTIYPEFNEEADLQVYDGELSDWQVLSEPDHEVERTSLDMTEPITIQSGACTSYTTTELTVDETVEPGGSADVEATVENDGVLDGTFNVTFTVDGEPVDEQEVSLETGESTTVSTTIEFDDEGTYAVGVGDETAEVTVDDGGLSMPGFGVTTVALAAVLTALLARYRS